MQQYVSTYPPYQDIAIDTEYYNYTRTVDCFISFSTEELAYIEMLSLVLLCASLLGVSQSCPFEVKLSAASEWFRLGEEIGCELTITNTLDQDLLLYHRNTPLEGGIKSDIFEVAHKTGKVSYDGLFFKRAAIDKRGESTLVRAKSSIQAKADLSSVYSIKQAGFYTVRLSSVIYYQTKAGNITRQHLTSELVSFKILPSEGAQQRLTIGEKLRFNQRSLKVSADPTPPPTAKDPLFFGDRDSVEETIAKKAWQGAYEKISAAPAVVDKAGEQYVTWFGEKDEGNQDTVKGVFERVQKAMQETQYTLFFHGPECERDSFAYSFFEGLYIYLCDGYLRAQDTHDTDSKLGIFVNQLTVVVGNTQHFDEINTPEKCQNLAKDVPLEAVRSAYNYEYFCETL